MSNPYGKPTPFTQKSHHRPYDFISPTRAELSAAGKNIVITGGGTGIGHGIASAFVIAGAKSVSIIGRTETKLAEAVKTISAASKSSATQVSYQVADVTSKVEIETAFERVVKRSGKIDILVSNASGGITLEPVTEIKAEDLIAEIQTTVIGALNVIQAYLPRAGPDPVILNTSTCLTHWPATPTAGGLSVPKAAALRLFDTLAAENTNVHVVNVQPGWVPTELNGFQDIAPDTADLPGSFYVWLASREARFLRGKFVWANWDAEELLARAKEISESPLLRIGLNGTSM